MNQNPRADIKAFFDPETWTFSYVVYAGKQSPCVVIDSVLNYDSKSGRTSTRSADELIGFIQSEQLTLAWILETHAHADHLTAAPYIQGKLGGKIVIGNHITNVQNVFKGVFNLDEGFAIDGSQFDYLLLSELIHQLHNLEAYSSVVFHTQFLDRRPLHLHESRLELFLSYQNYNVDLKELGNSR